MFSKSAFYFFLGFLFFFFLFFFFYYHWYFFAGYELFESNSSSLFVSSFFILPFALLLWDFYTFVFWFLLLPLVYSSEEFSWQSSSSVTISSDSYGEPNPFFLRSFFSLECEFTLTVLYRFIAPVTIELYVLRTLVFGFFIFIRWETITFLLFVKSTRSFISC